MTDFSKLSDQELNEALNFHRRQRNMSRGINEAAHARQTQMVRMLEAEEARRLNEEKPNKYVIYKHKDKYGVSQDIGTGYNWDHSYHHGYHDTVDSTKAWAAKHAGKYPHKIEVKEEVELDEAAMDKSHPIVKEYQAMKKHDIKTLRGLIAGQRRISDTSEFKTKDHAISSYLRAKHGNKAVDKAFGFNEEVEQLDELSPKTLKSYSDKANKSLDRLAKQRDTVEKGMSNTYAAIGKRNAAEKAAHGATTQAQHNKATATYRAADKSAKKNLAGHNDLAKRHSQLTKKINKRMDGIDRAYDKMHEEVAQIDEISKSTLGSYIKKASADQYLKGQAVQHHINKANDPFDKDSKKHMNVADVALRKASNRGTGIARAVDRLAKEEAEINEAADLRVTKIYNKWPKKATYAVHNTNRSYFKEFDSEEAARAHHKEKTAMKEEVFTEAKLERNKNTVGAHRLDRDSGDHKMYSAYTGSLVRRLHTVTDKDDNILGQGTSAASAMAKAKLKKPHRDALMHDDNQIVKVHDTRSTQNVGTQVTTPGKGKWFKDHDEAIAYAKSLPGKIRHADPKTGHVD
jgi:hypothetical protein